MSTNPSSPSFHPLSALYTEDDEPPSEGVKVYDNIAVFEGNLRAQGREPINQPGTSQRSQKSFSKKKKIQEEVRNRDLGKLRELMEMRRKMDQGQSLEDQERHKKYESYRQRAERKPRKKTTNLLTSMESLNEGPFSVVYKIAKSHSKCNVYTRDFCGLRGVCCGYIIAFDRYLNLAMVDVDETFRKPPIGEVAFHQKPLSISKLEEAVKSLALGKAEMQTPGSKQAVDGKTGDSTPQEQPKKTDQIADGQKVKTVGVRFFKNEIFHGGGPHLYHRHVDQLLVRGDSVVIVSPKQ